MTIELKGDKELKRLLKELGEKVAKRANRQGVNAGANPILRAARKSAPVATGLLKKSLIKKVKTYKSGNAVAVIGPSREVSSVIKTPSGKTKKHVPANIAHLVHDGHGGPHPAKGNPFLRRAFEATVQKALGIWKQKVWEVLQKEVAKRAKKK